MNDIASFVSAGKASLGIEFGSTRIKAVLVGPDFAPVAQGAFDWENRLEDGVWTYHDDEIWAGLRAAYAALAADMEKKHGVRLERLAAIGFSAMMHGYLAFDVDGKLLVPFRTWRNTITGEAADGLSRLLAFNIPQRWTIAHLHQAVRNGEAHVLPCLLRVAGDLFDPARRVRHLRFEFLDLRAQEWELPRESPGVRQAAFQPSTILGHNLSKIL